MRRRLGGWVALLALVLGLFRCFTGPAPKLPKANPRSVARWAETAEDSKFYSGYEKHPWVLVCTAKENNNTANLQLAKALDAQLHKHGRAAIDCIGPQAVARGLRTVRKVQEWVQPLLEPLNADLAFYPELLCKEDEENIKFSTRIHLRPIHVSNEATPETAFKAPADDNKISALATAVKEQVLKTKKVRVLGIGAACVNRIIKGQMRANSFLQDSTEGEVKHLWGFSSVAEDEAIEKVSESGPLRSVAFDFVQGPEP